MNRRAALWSIGLAISLTACSSAPPDAEAEADDTVDPGIGGTPGGSGGSAAQAGSKTDAGRADAKSPTGGDAAVGTGGSKGQGGSPANTPDAGGTAGSNAAPPKLGDKNALGLSLVFADEFDGPQIDRTVWRNELRQGYNNEEEYLTDSPDNQFIDNGNLVIRGIPSTQYAGANYTSAFLTTEKKKFFKYGYMEARMKMPQAMGCWPAFWMLPEDNVYGGWPLSGEIDIMEYWRYNPNTVWGTANYDNNGYKYSQGSSDVKVDLADDFHVFAVRWTDTKIDWFVDGTHYYSFDLTQPIAGRKPFNESFFLIVNLAIGGGRGGTPAAEQWPDDLRIDWVRVWQ
jgi:beta-glucanase (GH16 family)